MNETAEAAATADTTETESKAETAEAKAKPKKKRKTAKSYAIELGIKLGITALALFILLRFIIGIYIMHDNSAYPMIKDGDLCITFRLGTAEHGSEIAYESGGQIRFGRVIAVAGEEVDIKNNLVTVNGTGITTDTVYDTVSEGSAIQYPYKVPEDSVFVLNDFRSDLSDSRTFGAIPLSDSKGTVIFVMRRRGI